MNEATLIDLPGLSIKAGPSSRRVLSQTHFDCVIVVDAPPFSGTIEAILSGEDFESFARGLRKLRVPGKAVLGGNRAAELRIGFERQQGGEPGCLALEVSVCRSGDDPWPRLEFLIFDVPADFPSLTAKRFEDFAAR